MTTVGYVVYCDDTEPPVQLIVYQTADEAREVAKYLASKYGVAYFVTKLVPMEVYK